MKRLLILIALMALIAVPAVAITESFTLESSTYSTTTQDATTQAGNQFSLSYPMKMEINFDTISIPNTIIYYNNPTLGANDAGTDTFQIEYAGSTIGSGTMQILNGSMLNGAYTSQYTFTFVSWNPGTISGRKLVNVTWSGSISQTTYPMPQQMGVYDSTPVIIQPSSTDTGFARLGKYIVFSGGYGKNEIEITNTTPISASTLFTYSITKTGISQTKWYSNNVLNYTSSTNNADVTGIGYGSDIWFSMYVPSTGQTLNSSTYFPFYTAVAPTATPTPVPGTTPLPAGLVNTYFQCVDGNDNSRISGCNLALKDNFAGTWSNSTADDDGTHFITTHENATVSGYATATGYLATERTGLPTFSEGLYELIMWPDDAYCATPGLCGTVYDPGDGNVNLLVIVNDHDTGDSLSNAEIKLVETAGATKYGSTNSAGVATFIVTNQTQFRIVASKSGYTSTSKLHTTSAFGPDTVRLELSKSYVTVSPTVTITDASGNVVETLDMRSSNEKDEAMMEQLRTAGPDILELCILGIEIFIVMGILAALGMKL